MILARPALLLVGLAIGCSRVRERCLANGGQVEQVNCREVADSSWIPIDFGGGPTLMCIPSTSAVCDAVCRGARAEAGGPGDAAARAHADRAR